MKLKKSFLLICLAMTAMIIGSFYVYGEIQSPANNTWTTQTNITFVWNFTNSSGLIRVNESYNCTLYWNDTGAAHILWSRNSSTTSNAGGLFGGNDTNQSQTFYSNKTLVENTTGVSYNITCRNGTYDAGANAGEGAIPFSRAIIHIDTTAPVIDWGAMVNGTDFTGERMTLNVSINDTGSGLGNITGGSDYNVSGPGGYLKNTTTYFGIKNSASVWIFNATLNTSSGVYGQDVVNGNWYAYILENLDDVGAGAYTLYIYANDTINATNTSADNKLSTAAFSFDIIRGGLQSPGNDTWTADSNLTLVLNYTNKSFTNNTRDTLNCTAFLNNTPVWYKQINGSAQYLQAQTFYTNVTLSNVVTTSYAATKWNVTCDQGTGAGPDETYGNFTIHLDSTAPTILDAVALTDGKTGGSLTVNDTHFAGVLRINVSINDTGSGIYNRGANVSEEVVVAKIFNDSWTSTNSLNITKNVGYLDIGGWFNITIDISAYSEGHYNLTLMANDTINATNTSSDNRATHANYSFIVNNNVPSTPTYTCTKSNPALNEEITCTCTSYDESDVPAITSIDKPSTAELGAHTVTCNSSDGANSSLTSYTYTVYASAGGVSGGGGGGGAFAPPAEAGGAVVQSFTSIAANTPITMTVAETAAVAVKEVAITTTEDVASSKVTVTSKGTSAPAGVSAPSTGTAYQYIEISATNIANKVKSADVTFKVEKSWVNSNNIDPATVTLQRHADGVWNSLSTSKVSEDASAITYKASTPGFSVFAITGEKKGAVTPEKQIIPKITPEQIQAVSKQAKAGWYWIVLVIVLIGVGYWYYTSYYKKKKRK